MSSVRSLFFAVFRKKSADHRNLTQNRDAGLVCPLVVGDQSAQDNRRSIRRRYSRLDITCRDIRNQVSIDVRGVRHAVEFLQNIERDFFLGIDQRHDFELKRHFLELDARLRAKIVDDARRASCGWLEGRQRADRHRDFRAGSDDCLLVVARENHRSRDDFELPRRIERMHNRSKAKAGAEENTGAAVCSGPAARFAKFVRVGGSKDDADAVTRETRQFPVLSQIG